MSQDPERLMTVHFNDGTSMSFAFPTQADELFRLRKIEEIFKHDQLSIETEGSVVIVPFSSIKYVQVTPAADVLPANVIKGARSVS